MDFKLSDEQELIVDSSPRVHGERNWETYFHECDEKHVYPLRWVAGLCELGFDQIMLPESHGGLGLEQPCVTLMAVYEVLGRYGAPTYVLYQLPGFETIIREGTQEQIDAVMSTLGSGEQIWNSACTEPGAGSDVGALATTYKRENGKIYLNGTKTFITSSAGVKYLVIMAKNADDESQFTEFFVDMSKPGVKLSPLTEAGACAWTACCEVLPGQRGAGGVGLLRQGGQRLQRAACPTSTSSVGSSALATTAPPSARSRMPAKHAWTRIAFGKPVSSLPAELAEVRRDVPSSSTQHAQHAVRGGLGCRPQSRRRLWTPAAAAMCKYFCANASFEVDRRRHAGHGRHRRCFRASHQPHLARPARRPRLRRHRRDDDSHRFQGRHQALSSVVALHRS